METFYGQDATKNQALLVTSVVSISTNNRGTLYRNEYQFSFEKYITKLQEACSTLTCYHNCFTSKFLVQRMLYDM